MMARQITIDASGRLVIPKSVRQRHHLDAGSHLTLVDEEDRLVLIPSDREPRIVEKDGLLVIAGDGAIEIPDHRALREERLSRQGEPE